MKQLHKVGLLALAISSFGTAHTATVNATVVGWNLLGYSDAADVVVANAFGDKTKVTTVWKWTGTGWAFYSPELLDGGQAYALGKGYAFLTTIKSGDGFWVNAKQTFSATLPAPAPVVDNPAALSGITNTLQTFIDEFYFQPPTSTNLLSLLVDDTMLMGGINKATFLQAMLNGNGPRVGEVLGAIQLVNPLDAGAVPNDANHQWFTFDIGNGNGPNNAWLAIKNNVGEWLLAGDQRQFGFNTTAQAVKVLQLNGSVSYFNQINTSVENVPSTPITQIVLTGPGVVPSSGLPIYTTTAGQIWYQPCNAYGVSTNCIDVAAATATSQYTAKAYGSDPTTPLYTYTNVLPRAPIPTANLAGLTTYPTISSVNGTWSPNTDVTVNWTAAAGTFGDWVNIGAWTSTGQNLFRNIGKDLVGNASGSTTLTVPNYSGVINGHNVWLSVRDANGNRLALDKQL